MGQAKSEISLTIDQIEAEVYGLVKPYGFRKHGRTLHRFVDGDISQVISFQPGQAYLNMTHMMTVNLGIRVPECFERVFISSAPTKKYYHEYECNIQTKVLPVFEVLDSRDAILLYRRDYPCFDILNDHLILLEEAMIYGRRGQTDRAKALFEQYYQSVLDRVRKDEDAKHLKGHLSYLDGLAGKLGLR